MLTCLSLLATMGDENKVLVSDTLNYQVNLYVNELATQSFRVEKNESKKNLSVM